MTSPEVKIANPKPQAGFSFSGHETFVFRYGWLKKAVDEVRQDPCIFSSAEAMVKLGVGKNMVRSIRHWALATRVLAEEPHTRGLELKPTPLGDFIFGPGGVDPYLEDANSLWLLHWNLVTNEQRSTTWSWAFNLLLANEFSRDSLTAVIRSELQKRGAKLPSENSLRRDIDCFVRSYVKARAKALVPEDSLDCPLVELELIEDDDGANLFHFKRGIRPSLSDAVFVFALLDFWDKTAPNREALPFSEIAYGFGSPSCGFKLDESSLVERLDRLESVTKGVLAYTETAGLKQVYRRGPVPGFQLLERYYRTSFVTVPVGA